MRRSYALCQDIGLEGSLREGGCLAQLTCQHHPHVQDEISTLLVLWRLFLLVADTINLLLNIMTVSRFYTLILILCCLPAALTFTWDIWSLFRKQTLGPTDPSLQRVAGKISHQAASDPLQDALHENVDWYDANGTPLFYSAWRAKSVDTSPEPSKRSSLLKYGSRVACWPSTGGVWIKHADLVDLNFLGLERQYDTPRQFNQTAEDEFCEQLRKVGAQWWRLPPSFEDRKHLGADQFTCATLEECFEPEVKFGYLIAWTEDERAACFVSAEEAEKKSDAKLSIYNNAMDMDERCNGILVLGGKWCRCKEECPQLKDLDWDSREKGGWGCNDPGWHEIDIDEVKGAEREL